MHISAGAFQRIYDPSLGQSEAWYINDHCFIQDSTGLWHMFGITRQEPADPLNEKFFAHATSLSLVNPQWQRQPHVLTALEQRPWEETHVWAPHVVQHEGLYWMYYCAGGPDHTRYKIHLATSKDLFHWERHPANPMIVDGFDARDPMLIRYENRWILYYTATSAPEGGQHVVAAQSSSDLIHWSDKRVVFTHSRSGTYGGPTESPFVVTRDGKFYLFLCTNTPYNNTAAYESPDPFHWESSNRVADIPAHAAEVIILEQQSYISRAGWGEGGLYLAPLQWNA